MRVLDLIRFAVGGLWRQKGRTTLTVLGVAVGATSLAFSLSLGVGLRRVITNEFHSREGFWEVHVTSDRYQTVGEVPPEKLKLPDGIGPDRADRLRKVLEARAKQAMPAKAAAPLTPEKLAEFAAMPDVA